MHVPDFSDLDILHLCKNIIYFYEGKNISNYLCAKVQGIILAMLFIIIFFYTYTGIIGTNFAIVDISSFFIAVVLGQYVAYQKMQLTVSCNKIIPIIVLVVLCLCFFAFTFFPPHIGLFKDPVSGMFGI